MATLCKLPVGWKHVSLQRRSFGNNTVITQPVVWRQEYKDQTCNLLSHHKFDPSLFPLQAVVINDTTRASTAALHIQNNNALLYQGDYHNARQLLTALKRRVVHQDKYQDARQDDISQQWKRQRSITRERSRKLNRLLLMVDSDHSLRSYRRAPDVSDILLSAFGQQTDPYVIPLREVLGMVGANEWKKKGVFIAQMNQFIYPHYGVFVPTRREYLDLILQTCPPPRCTQNSGLMLDVGVGTGVIAAVMLLNEKVGRVIGTDINPKAITCAKENLDRMGLSDRAELEETNLFPRNTVQADLIVCNPPWLPGQADSMLDQAVYDDELCFLRSFLSKAGQHLATDGEVWLVLSNLSELLGLRTRLELMQMIHDGNLQLVDVYSTKPVHAKARNMNNGDDAREIAKVRAKETTLLYRLKKKTM